MRRALRIAALCLAGPALTPAVAAAQAILHATRDGDQVRIEVTAYWRDMPAVWTALVVQRSTVGLCGDETTITPAPWPREARPSSDPGSEYSLTDPVPGGNRCYLYAVHAVDAQGQLTHVCGAGEQPYDYVQCGTPILTRGLLVLDFADLDGPPRFEACAEGCWPKDTFLDLHLVDRATYAPYIQTGIPVDIYGWMNVTDLTIRSFITATRVVATPSGACGPVPVRATSWGQVKASYR